MNEYDEIVAVVRQLPTGQRTKNALNVRVRYHLYDGTLASLAGIYDVPECDTWHLATHFTAAHSPSDVDALLQANVVLGTQLLEQAGTTRGRFISCGSYWQHVWLNGAPLTLYSALKIVFEQLLDFFASAKDMSIVSLTLGDTYGPNDHRGKLIASLIASIDARNPLGLSAGEQKLSFTHVDDVISALLIARLQAVSGRVERFAVMEPRRIEVRKLVEKVIELSANPLYIELGARQYRPFDLLEPSTLPPPLPGWEPTVSLDEGLARLLHSG